jgi:hypothetical protein
MRPDYVPRLWWACQANVWVGEDPRRVIACLVAFVPISVLLAVLMLSAGQTALGAIAGGAAVAHAIQAAVYVPRAWRARQRREPGASS